MILLKRFRKLIPIMLFTTLILSQLIPSASIAYADGGTTPETQTEEVEVTCPEGEEGEPAESSEEGEVPTESASMDVSTSEATEVEEAEPAPDAIPSVEDEPSTEDSSDSFETADAESPAQEAEPLLAPDPYFTLGSDVYRFSSDPNYCTTYYPTSLTCYQGQPNPIQSAIDNLKTQTTFPADETIHVEAGSYSGDAVINSTGWTAGVPALFILESESDSASTSITGSVTIQGMSDFILQGFTVTDGVVATGNTGTLTLQDVVANNTSGDGISVTNHDGEVILDNVQANSNPNNGATIDNTAGSDGVTITNSTFNDNNTSATSGQQAGLEVRSDGEVVLDNVTASGNLDGDGASIEADGVTVSNSTFNNNTSPTPGYGVGLAAQSSDGPIVLRGVTAKDNEESGALLWFPASAYDPTNTILVANSTFKDNGGFGVWAQPEGGTVTFNCLHACGNTLGSRMVPVGETVILIPCPPSKKDGIAKPYPVGVLLSTEEPRFANPLNGVLVTFPPIVIIDEEELARGKVWPLELKDLPAELPLGDLFMAGVKVEIFNAEFLEDPEDPDDALLKLEFHIPAYMMDRTFAVLWWDVEAGDWVELPFEIEPHDRLPGGKVVVKWPETGIFVLVLR